MSRLISRDPVVPIPGYSFVTIQLDDQDNVADTRVAFPAMPDISRLSLGLPFTALPALIARVSGISSISHLLASALACEAIMNVSIPETAHRLRELAACASILQSHALGFHSLSSSDLLVGIEGVPSYRAVSDLFEAFPVLARDAVYLRQFGQRVITMLTGGHTPSEWLVAGGVTAPITEETRLEIVTGLGKACGAVRRGLDAFKRLRDQVIEDIGHFGCFPSLYAGVVNGEGGLTFYDGQLRVRDGALKTIAQVWPVDYRQVFAETARGLVIAGFAGEGDSELSPGIYRVGPLARLNVVDKLGTIGADAELFSFRKLSPAASFYYHYARLIEIQFCLDKFDELVHDPAITGARVIVESDAQAAGGVGMIEAPRGTLVHACEVDDQGRVSRLTIIPPAAHNHLAISRCVRQVADNCLEGRSLDDGLLDRLEAIIRAYDPCLVSSARADIRLPLHVRLLDPSGALLAEVRRP